MGQSAKGNVLFLFEKLLKISRDHSTKHGDLSMELCGTAWVSLPGSFNSAFISHGNLSRENYFFPIL